MHMLATEAFLLLTLTRFVGADFTLQVDFIDVVGLQLITGIGVAGFRGELQILLWDLDGIEIAAGSRRRQGVAGRSSSGAVGECQCLPLGEPGQWQKRKNPLSRAFSFESWCPEEDSNLHEVAPAST